MSLSRHAARKDTGSTAIVDALRDLGAFVAILSGEGIPDILWGFRGHWGPMELKNPGGEPVLDKRNGKTYRSAPGKLTPAQERFIAKAAKAGLPVPVASTPAEAVAFVLAATRTNARQPEPASPTRRDRHPHEATGNHKPCPRCINSPHTPEG